MAGERDARDLVKELAAAVSTQAQVSNRAWIALMTVALVAVLPRVSPAGQSREVALPFGLGPVDATWFHPILFAMLVVLAIAFAAAHAQQVRAQKLAQTVVDSLAKRATPDEEIHPRELFDMLRLPSVNRVAPLAQSLRGRYQFYRTSTGCPGWLVWLSTGYYALLKLASLVVYFGLPAWALSEVYTRATTSASGFLWWLVTLGGSLAGVTLLQVFLTDVRYTIAVLQHISRNPSLTGGAEPPNKRTGARRQR